MAMAAAPRPRPPAASLLFLLAVAGTVGGLLLAQLPGATGRLDRRSTAQERRGCDKLNLNKLPQLVSCVQNVVFDSAALPFNSATASKQPKAGGGGGDGASPATTSPDCCQVVRGNVTTAAGKDCVCEIVEALKGHPVLQGLGVMPVQACQGKINFTELCK